MQVINRNGARGTGKPPADYLEQRRILKQILRDDGHSAEPPTREEMKEEGGGDSKLVADLRNQIKNLKKDNNGANGGGRGGRGAGRGGADREEKPRRSDGRRENKLGRPVFDRRDAKDRDGKVHSTWYTVSPTLAHNIQYTVKYIVHTTYNLSPCAQPVCVNYSLGTCKEGEKESCHYGGRELLHKV